MASQGSFTRFLVQGPPTVLQGEMEHGLTVGPGFREKIEKALTRLNETSVGMRNCPPAS
jgi:hypothetical protein